MYLFNVYENDLDHNIVRFMSQSTM